MPIHSDKNTHKSKGLSKKLIRRFKKADLLRMCKDGLIPCSKKDSKNMLVDKVFKNKKLRSSLTALPPRAQSEKQKANTKRLTERMRIGKDFKNEKVIKQRAQFVAEIRKIEDTETIGRGQPNEFTNQKKIGEGKGRFRETQVERLKQQANTNTREENIRKRELIDSTLKSSDIDDRRLKDAKGQPSKRRLQTAEGHAKSTVDKRFGEGAVVSEEATMDSILALMNLPIPDLVKKLTQLKKSNPQSPIVIVIEGLLEKKKSN